MTRWVYLSIISILPGSLFIPVTIAKNPGLVKKNVPRKVANIDSLRTYHSTA
jgi:hypothetical protein